MLLLACVRGMRAWVTAGGCVCVAEAPRRPAGARGGPPRAASPTPSRPRPRPLPFTTPQPPELNPSAFPELLVDPNSALVDFDQQIRLEGGRGARPVVARAGGGPRRGLARGAHAARELRRCPHSKMTPPSLPPPPQDGGAPVAQHGGGGAGQAQALYAGADSRRAARAGAPASLRAARAIGLAAPGRLRPPPPPRAPASAAPLLTPAARRARSQARSRAARARARPGITQSHPTGRR